MTITIVCLFVFICPAAQNQMSASPGSVKHAKGDYISLVIVLSAASCRAAADYVLSHVVCLSVCLSVCVSGCNCYNALEGAEYCDQFVCLSICLSVRAHISGTAGPIFTKFFVQIPSGRGSLLLWWRCDTLYFGFMDDVTFGRSGLYGNAW